jgi:hypothetical protein
LKGGKRTLIIEAYDTALTKLWETRPTIKYESQLKRYAHDSTHLFLLVENKSTAYDIFELELQTGNVNIFPIIDIIPLEISHFKVFNKIIFFGGVVDNRPAVLWYDYLNDKKPKVLPQINSLKAELEEMTFSQDQTCVSVLLSSRKTNKPNLFIQNYSLDGHLLNKNAIILEKTYDLLAHRPYVFSSASQLIFGAYAKKNSLFAQGFYVARLTEAGIENINFYDFSRFINIFNHLTEQKKQKLLQKVQKKQQKGKIQGFDEQILLSELVIYDNTLYLFADMYLRANLQQANSLKVPNLTPYGSRSSRFYQSSSSSIFSSNNANNSLPSHLFKYKNCVAVAFDNLGNLLWDNAFEYKNLDTYSLQPQSSIAIEKDSLTFLQVEEENFLTKKTAKALTSNAIDETKTDTLFTNAKPIESIKPHCLAWYDGYFLVYDTQRLKLFDAQKGVEYREIFYITKLCVRSRGKQEKENKEK